MAETPIKSGNINDIINDLEKEVREHPNSVIAHHRLALAYWRGKRMNEAISEFEKALEIDPSSYEIRINLGTLFFQLGRIEDGIRENKTALDAHPVGSGIHRTLLDGRCSGSCFRRRCLVFYRAVASSGRDDDFDPCSRSAVGRYPGAVRPRSMLPARPHHRRLRNVPDVA